MTDAAPVLLGTCRPTHRFKGIVHHAAGDRAYASRGAAVFRSRDGGETWTPLTRIPLDPASRWLSATRLTRRLSRSMVHHVIPGEDGRITIFGFGRILVVEESTGRIEHSTPIVGSRPLCIYADGRRIYYGEYRDNAERSVVHIWGSEDGGRRWSAARALPGVRHVHGVFRDPYQDLVWVTTGDDDRETGLWVTADHFTSLDRVTGTGQQMRAVQLLFSKAFVYFGSDTPLEQNAIYRLERQTGRVERLVDVQGSVFYGCRRGGAFFFSTACEPSRVNRAGHAAVWASPDGERWQEAGRFRKDPWPMKLFQYGQVLFPTGPAHDPFVWLVPFATEHDQVSYRFPAAPDRTGTAAAREVGA